ncbi:hypothetical protein K438DRAFT_1771220 [Mycena galopus ATCC 62051]|nr:hypothetical protein K438DRAFT_1771220 [Mycena galopus ATCC 62051]
MADRVRREGSTACPGKIVNAARQQRRTKAQIEKDNKKIADKKEAKSRPSLKTFRAEDEHARASAARPDLVTAELKRAVNARAAVENPQPPTEPQWMMRTSAATLEDPFAAPSHPAFKPTLDDIWNTYFPAARQPSVIGEAMPARRPYRS